MQLYLFPTRRLLLVCLLALVAALTAATPRANAIEDKYWASTPYRIHLTLAVDSQARPEPQLAEEIAATIVRRIEATLSPLWEITIDQANGKQRLELRNQIPETAWEDLPEPLQGFDKLVTLTITANALGYEVRCREYDAYVRRWGPLGERLVRQRSLLGEEAFQMMIEAFSPLATVDAMPKDDDHVQLTFRGSHLPRRTDEFAGAAPLVDPGQVFLPVLRRTNRAGDLLENGILPVPWTYVTAETPAPAGWLAAVHTGSRRPFGGRRRGSVQKLAIGLKESANATQVRFHARDSEDVPLPGYEVFVRDEEKETSDLLAVTDGNGVVSVPPGDKPVVMLLLRSDGLLLAKIPVAPGAAGRLDVPIPDDPTRLRAQAELTEIREQLIDVVARRAIYIARVKDRIKKGQVDEAQDIMASLNNLPGRSWFDQQINAAQRGSSSSDPQVQQRIDKLFEDTRTLLVRFLDSRPITELQSEVTAAKRGA